MAILDRIEAEELLKKRLPPEGLRALAVLREGMPTHSEKEIASAARTIDKFFHAIAQHNFRRKIAIASLMNTPVELQKDILPYVLPKVPSEDTLNLKGSLGVRLITNVPEEPDDD